LAFVDEFYNENFSLYYIESLTLPKVYANHYFEEELADFLKQDLLISTITPIKMVDTASKNFTYYFKLMSKNLLFHF